MIKKSIIAIATLAAIAGASLPALASNTDSVFGSTNDYQQTESAKNSVAQRLAAQGIQVSNIDEWGGYVRATVQLPNGQQATRFFQPGTLAPVSVNNLN
jgi:hypothetical protein